MASAIMSGPEETPHERVLRVLMLEDSPTDAELIERELTKAGIRLATKRVLTKEDFRLAINEFNPELILADFNLPQFNAIEALRILKPLRPEIPFLLVTGTQSEEVAVQCIKEGAVDYILKSSLKRLPSAFINALERGRIEQQKAQAEAQIRILFQAIEQSPVSILITDPEGRIEYANRKCLTLSGYTNKEIIGKNPRVFKSPETAPAIYEELWRTITNGGEWRGELRNKSKAGGIYRELVTISPINDPDGRITHFLAIKEDITGQRDLEDQLRQAQKMETVGTLAGGIAHDFNNILGIILGYSTLLQKDGLSPQKTNESLEAIRRAVERGATLVRQLLTFARKSDPQFTTVDINDIVRELLKMLEATFPKAITFSINISEPLPPISADPAQLHQALLNLCINARDAMGKGGTLTLSTHIVSGSQLRGKLRGQPGAEYLCISVMDTGVGMDDQTVSRIFEPFFTTKGIGKGTGLGLAVAYGVVNRHRGHMEVESTLGTGTTFRIYLPIREEPSAELHPTPAAKQGIVQGGSETILLVEDEVMLRDLVRTLMQEKGYAVLAAGDGLEGIELYKRHQDQVQLVLTDVGLPKASGIDVLREVRALNSNVRVILASGYLDPEDRKQMKILKGSAFIQKPYVPEELLRTVRELLDKSRQA